MAQFIAGLRDQPSEEAFSPIAVRNLQESLLLEHETKNKAARKVLANNAKKIRNGLQNKRKQIKEDAIQHEDGLSRGRTFLGFYSSIYWIYGGTNLKRK